MKNNGVAILELEYDYETQEYLDELFKDIIRNNGDVKESDWE